MAESETKVKSEPGSGAARSSGDGSQKTGLTEAMEEVLEFEEQVKDVGIPHTRLEVQAMPTRQYLDYTVVPVLLDAMTAVDRTRRVSSNPASAKLWRHLSVHTYSKILCKTTVVIFKRGDPGKEKIAKLLVCRLVYNKFVILSFLVSFQTA